MESINDFFKHINQRLSSPFIFSFIISWLVCNWKVSIDLLYHDHDFLKIDGYTSYVGLITNEVTCTSGVGIPLLCAFAYTFGSPFLNAVIHSCQTYFQKLEDNWSLNILKGGKIPIDKYISLKKSLDERGHILEETIKGESELSIKLNFERDNNFQLQQDNNLLQTQLSGTKRDWERSEAKLKRITEYNASPIIMQGKWRKERGNKANSDFKIETVEIASHQYRVIENEKALYKGNIQFYQFNEENNKLFFVIDFLSRTQNGQTKALINELTFNNVNGTVAGSEDSDIPVIYYPINQ